MFDGFRLLVLVGSVAVVAGCGGSDDDAARPPQPLGTLAVTDQVILPAP